MFKDLTVDERIERGVQALDEIEPDWRKRIDLKTLDVGSCKYCVLGQVFGDFSANAEILTFYEGDAPLAYLGFDVDDASAYANSFTVLQDAWKRRLKRELEQ